MNNGHELVGTRADSVARPRASSRAGWFHRESVQGFLWIAAAFLYLAFFIAYPFFMSIYLSVSSARVGSPDSHFVGLQNYTLPISSSTSRASIGKISGPRSGCPTAPIPGRTCTRAA